MIGQGCVRRFCGLAPDEIAYPLSSGHMFTPCSQLFDHLVLVIVYWEVASGVVYFLLLEWFLVSRGVVPSK